MNSRNGRYAFAALTLGALATFPATAVRADDMAAEIRLLKARLKQLEAKVAAQDRKQKQLQTNVRNAAAPAALVCKDGPCPPAPAPPPPVFVSFKNGLKVETLDHDFSFKIGGRIFVEGGVSSEPVQAFLGVPPFLPPRAASGFSNQVGFRQARLEVEGKAFNYWNYKFQFDFAGNAQPTSATGIGGSTSVAGGIRDAFIALRYFEPVTFQVGNMFEPNSLERVSSSKYRDFMERALASDLLAGNRHIGLAAVTGGPAPGIMGNSNWSAKAGIFSTSFEDGAQGPLPGGHQYWDAAGRLTYAPILTEDSLLHIGGSVRYQKPNDATALSDDRVLSLGSTLRTEANTLGENLLGTQSLTCAAPAFQVVGGNCTKDVLGYGAEAVASYGPFSVQAEYLGMHYDRDPGLIALLNAPGGSSLNFSGYYVYATWYLTGESRAASYMTYPREFNSPATFDQINIKNPLSAGGWGAWEIAARLSEINLNDGGFLVAQPVGVRPNIQGGRETDFTLGLNWYPDRGFRIMANWVRVMQLAAPFNRPDINGIHPNLFLMRAQVDW